jgi:hypothetical protein
MTEGRSGGEAAATGDSERRRHSVIKRSETWATARGYETECGAAGLGTIWKLIARQRGAAGTGTDATASGLGPSGLTGGGMGGLASGLTDDVVLTKSRDCKRQYEGTKRQDCCSKVNKRQMM